MTQHSGGSKLSSDGAWIIDVEQAAAWSEANRAPASFRAAAGEHEWPQSNLCSLQIGLNMLSRDCIGKNIS
jgi:hypothetical protein